MAVFEVFSHPEKRIYKAHICSKASIVFIFCIALTFIPPLLIAFRSQGFWLKFAEYKEQPDVDFKHQLILVLETDVENGDGSMSSSYVTYSTYNNYNSLQMGHIRTPIIKSREEDTNRDGRKDKIYLDIQMPLFDSEQVYSVQMLLFFNYALHKMSDFQMESMAYIQYTNPKGGSMFETLGDLTLVQKEPLSHRGTDVRFNVPVIDETKIYSEDYDFLTIFKSYSERNMTTIFTNTYPVWTSGRGAGQPFVVKATITYPEELIQYYPGFWQLIKEAWIQYFAILLVFMFVFQRIKIFIFSNQLVTTIVDRPQNKLKTY